MKFSKKTILFIIAAAFIIELLIITYNQYTGFIKVASILNFIIRLITGGFFASLMGLVFLYINSYFLILLDRRFPWESSISKRTIVEFTLTVLSGTSLGLLITLFVNLLFPYIENLYDTLVTNALITTVANMLFVIALEAVFIFKRNTEIRLKAEQLEKENSLIRFETLKSQLNPHFLFNSLNTLSALIGKDVNTAQSFVDEFSWIYRYILEVIDKQVVTLKEEIDFAKAYLFLQKIRFGEALKADINITVEKLDYLVPPLSIQTLLENALKHNKAILESPLQINIFDDGDWLIMKNNIQCKLGKIDSKGIGLNNLKKRYIFISGITPEFNLTQNEYIAKIPLIIPQ